MRACVRVDHAMNRWRTFTGKAAGCADLCSRRGCSTGPRIWDMCTCDAAHTFTRACGAAADVGAADVGAADVGAGVEFVRAFLVRRPLAARVQSVGFDS